MADYFNHGIVQSEVPAYFTDLMYGTRRDKPTVSHHTDPNDTENWVPGTDGFYYYKLITDAITHSMEVEWINRTAVFVLVVLILAGGQVSDLLLFWMADAGMMIRNET